MDYIVTPVGGEYVFVFESHKRFIQERWFIQ